MFVDEKFNEFRILWNFFHFCRKISTLQYEYLNIRKALANFCFPEHVCENSVQFSSQLSWPGVMAVGCGGRFLLNFKKIDLKLSKRRFL